MTGPLWMQLVFWGAIAALGYTFVGYPLLAYAWARLRPWNVTRRPRPKVLPTVSVVVVVHNEQERITGRIQNLLGLDYPSDRLSIVVASDGSTDRTVAIAKEMAGQRVRVLDYRQQRGKPAVLNDTLSTLYSEVVVLADARQQFHPQAIRALVAPFADPQVGAVGGELMLGSARGGAVGEGVGFYWRYEKAMRHWESRIDSTVGVTGAIYAVRRHLFAPLPTDTLLDDVLIPMRVVREGYRVVFEPRAQALDEVSASAGAELSRKVRTIAGNFQLFARERWLLNPRRNRLWLQMFSHKGMRLLGPLMLLLALASNAALAHAPFYAGLLVAQLLAYGAALLGLVLSQRNIRWRPLSVPYVFFLLNWATVVGFVRFLARRQPVTWKRAVERR